jgi:hypothetical protein
LNNLLDKPPSKATARKTMRRLPKAQVVPGILILRMLVLRRLPKALMALGVRLTTNVRSDKGYWEIYTPSFLINRASSFTHPPTARGFLAHCT